MAATSPKTMEKNRGKAATTTKTAMIVYKWFSSPICSRKQKTYNMTTMDRSPTISSTGKSAMQRAETELRKTSVEEDDHHTDARGDGMAGEVGKQGGEEAPGDGEEGGAEEEVGGEESLHTRSSGSPPAESQRRTGAVATASSSDRRISLADRASRSRSAFSASLSLLSSSRRRRRRRRSSLVCDSPAAAAFLLSPLRSASTRLTFSAESSVTVATGDSSISLGRTCGCAASRRD
uniref:Uncharacterized protein n=1 Tax=Oryza sativa subsp. japonica TaxID=39947 RepID=Q2R015_ORYSJ|nr:hypothetical protein LOC_Os11g44110 [Oryza sativa Japonica Group]